MNSFVQENFQQNAKGIKKDIYYCHTDKFLSQRLLEEDESLSGLIKALKILVIIMKVMTQIMSAILPGNSTSLLLGISFKLTTRIKYMDVTYSTDLYKSLADIWNERYLSLGYSFGMPNFVGDNQNPKDIPSNFAKYGIASNFLINFWESLVILIFIMLFYLGAQLTESLLGNNKNALSQHQIAQKFRIVIQCLLLTQLYLIFGDIILFACLEWRYLDLSQAFTTLSFGFSLLFTVLPAGCLVLQFLLVQKFQQDRNTNPADDERLLDFYKIKYPVCQIFFRDFKTQGVVYQSFLFLLILRDVLFSIAIAFLSISPLAQSIILMILSLPIGVFIVIFRPFKSWWNMAQQILYELIIFIVAIDMLIMETFDQSNLAAINPRKKIGLSIIIVQICFISIGLLYLFIMLFAFLNDLYKNWQLSQNVQNRSDRLRDLNARISQGIFPIPIEESMIQQERLIIGSTTGNSQIMMRQEEVFNFDTLEVPSDKFNSSNQSIHMSMSNTNYKWRRNRKKIFPISSRPNEDSSFTEDSFLTSTKNLMRRPLHQRAPRRNPRRQMNKSMSQFRSSEPGFLYLKKNEGLKASEAHSLMGKTYVHPNSTHNDDKPKSIGDIKSKRAQILEDLNKKFAQKPKVNSLVEL